MGLDLSSTRRKASLLVIGLLMLSAVAATQYATSDIGYSFTITGADSGIRFIGHDMATDNIALLRADNSQGANLHLELGNWARGQTVTWTGAFAIVNENQNVINITAVEILGTGNTSLQVWLHDNADTKATEDSGTLIFNGGSGPQSFTWELAAGNGDSADAGTTATPVNSNSNTRLLTDSDDAENSDHVWVQVKLTIPESASNGSFTGTVSFSFESDD